MPHIIILDEWQTAIDQLHDYTETIADNLENSQYEDKELTDAQDIISETTALFGGAVTKPEIDAMIGRCETLLEI